MRILFFAVMRPVFSEVEMSQTQTSSTTFLSSTQSKVETWYIVLLFVRLREVVGAFFGRLDISRETDNPQEHLEYEGTKVTCDERDCVIDKYCEVLSGSVGQSPHVLTGPLALGTTATSLLHLLGFMKLTCLNSRYHDYTLPRLLTSM